MVNLQGVGWLGSSRGHPPIPHSPLAPGRPATNWS